MRSLLAITAMTGALMGVVPALADGDYLIGGATLSGAWKPSFGPAPGPENEGRNRFAGGDDQYLVGPTRSLAWDRPADDAVRTATAGPGSGGNFLFASQGG